MSGITDPGELHFKDGIWGWFVDTWLPLIADAAGHLQIDVLTSGLPAGGATAAHQVTMITALELIDDLRGALDSVDTDELVVNVDETVLQAVTHNIYNVTMTLANTEYNQALPANTKKFTIKCRTLYHIKLAFTNGQSGITYLTIPPGMAYSEDLIRPATLTLYFQCPTAAQIAEIVAWS